MTDLFFYQIGKILCIMTIVIYLMLLFVFVNIYIRQIKQKNKKNKTNEKNEKNEKNKHESFIINESSHDPKREKVQRTTFPTFEFHAEKNGYLLLGEFLINWGHSDKRGHFVTEFDYPKGGIATPFRGESGINNVRIRHLNKDHVRIRAKDCERPNTFFTFGFKNLTVPRSKITVNTFNNKPNLFKKIAYIEPKEKNQSVSSGSSCTKTSTVRPWHKDK